MAKVVAIDVALFVLTTLAAFIGLAVWKNAGVDSAMRMIRANATPSPAVTAGLSGNFILNVYPQMSVIHSSNHQNRHDGGLGAEQFSISLPHASPRRASGECVIGVVRRELVAQPIRFSGAACSSNLTPDQCGLVYFAL